MAAHTSTRVEKPGDDQRAGRSIRGDAFEIRNAFCDITARAFQSITIGRS